VDCESNLHLELDLILYFLCIVSCKAYNGVGSKHEDAHVTVRRKPMTGKKLKNLNFQHLEEVWNSSDDDEMEEATRSLSNPLTFAAAVKRQEECDQKRDICSNQFVDCESNLHLELDLILYFLCIVSCFSLAHQYNP
jgi:hypothetical protein